MVVCFYSGFQKVCDKVEFSTDGLYVILDGTWVYEIGDIAGIKE